MDVISCCRAEVAGRLYRASYRHMAHFTLLLILFAAAAYKSEVCWMGVCLVCKFRSRLTTLTRCCSCQPVHCRSRPAGIAAAKCSANLRLLNHAPLQRTAFMVVAPLPNIDSSHSSWLRPTACTRTPPFPPQHTAFMALTLLSEVNSTCHLARKMLGVAATSSGSTGAGAAAAALAAVDRVTFVAFR